MSQTERELDVVLLGASGFTGRLVAAYLLSQYGVDGKLRWAMAGRNRSKLDAVRKELQGSQPEHEIPLLIADSSDAGALGELAQKTRVICTTVGPYALYGSKVVEACARHGTHYCDLTGEVHWMRDMIDRFQSTAAASGARIVHTCGFDSIPSDLGVLFLQQAMLDRHGVAAQHIKYRVADVRGGMSGGTIASMINMLEQAAKDPALGTLIADPYALNPGDAPRGNDGPDQTRAEFDTDFERWTLPFVMAAINTRVVRRSNALLDFQYGKDFAYDEAILAPARQGALVSKLAAAAMSAGTASLTLAPVRALATRFLPAPGEGPSLKQRENGFYDILLHAKHPHGANKDMRARVTGDRDPGYGSTAKMLGESAVCLALDEHSVAGGFWTPASAMGVQLIQRLEDNAGLDFSLVNI
jgi:short subunit dehydrogenase-like uncharacterized protein